MMGLINRFDRKNVIEEFGGYFWKRSSLYLTGGKNTIVRNRCGRGLGNCPKEISGIKNIWLALALR